MNIADNPGGDLSLIYTDPPGHLSWGTVVDYNTLIGYHFQMTFDIHIESSY